MFNLNNKKFKAEFNSKSGEVSNETLFSYYQKEAIIWATYEGGEILKGNIIGKVVGNHLEFVYQHINKNQELMTGICKSYPEFIEDNKIRLKEFWQWTCKDKSKGTSVLIEY